MIIRKIALCSLLCTMLPSAAYWNLGVSIEIPITKKTLLVGAAVGGSLLVAAYLYKYFTTMTIAQAERLCDEVSSYVEEITIQYHQELAAIDNGLNDEALKVELQNIIASGDSESPYLSYTNGLERVTQRAVSFEKKFSKGIPQLERAYELLVAQDEEEDDAVRSAEIERYKRLFHTIAGLRELVHAVRFKMQRLVRLCKQFDAYRQEKIIERLQAIERQMIINNMQPKTIHCYHRC